MLLPISGSGSYSSDSSRLLISRDELNGLFGVDGKRELDSAQFQRLVVTKNMPRLLMDVLTDVRNALSNSKSDIHTGVGFGRAVRPADQHLTTGSAAQNAWHAEET